MRGRVLGEGAGCQRLLGGGARGVDARGRVALTRTYLKDDHAWRRRQWNGGLDGCESRSGLMVEV